MDCQSCKEPILDSINEGVFTVDLNWRITSFNRAAERITGIRREDAIGQRCSEVFRANICEGACALRETLSTGRPTVDTTVFIIDAAGIRIPIKISAAILSDPDGRVIGGVETFQDLRQIEQLRNTLQEKYTFGDIVGKSPSITQLTDLLPQVADSASSVLIGGDSGTGKELFAKAIHDLSPRKDKPFVVVNCAAIPDALLESELFGYKAGAFTDAKRDKPGRFLLADGGTILLDEIGDITPAMQAKLLRVLQEHAFEPLGSVEPIRVDVRVVAATNKDLSVLVSQGSFREDLFYRIHVIHLEIPRLVDRREDIPLLVDHLVAKFNLLQGKEVAGASPETLAVLMEHDYPGNVRELQNILEHAFVLCPGGLIEAEHLPPYLRSAPPRLLLHKNDEMDLRSSERLIITEALERHGGHRARTARELGIDPSTLYRKIKALGIAPPGRDGRTRPD